MRVTGRTLRPSGGKFSGMTDDAYQSVEDLRVQLAGAYKPDQFFNDNAEKRFDQLLEKLEQSARGVIENHHDDQTFAFEEDRIDEIRATDDAAIGLVYPIRDISKVEIKRSIGREWSEYDADRWDHSDHSLILRKQRRGSGSARGTRRNELLDNTNRRTWSDIAAKLRVTYDRGWDPVPPAVIDIQTELVIRMLRNRRMEQNISAVEPENIRQVGEALVTLTDEQRQRIDSITGFGGKSMSV